MNFKSTLQYEAQQSQYRYYNIEKINTTTESGTTSNENNKSLQQRTDTKSNKYTSQMAIIYTKLTATKLPRNVKQHF